LFVNVANVYYSMLTATRGLAKKSEIVFDLVTRG